MFFLKAAYCRLVQMSFRLVLPLLPYREPDIIPSCKDLSQVFQREKVQSALIVTDAGIVANGLLAPLEEVLAESTVPYIIYDKTQPNPTVSNVEEALTLYQQNT